MKKKLATRGKKICGKPVAGSTCMLLVNHRGVCIRPIGRAIKPASQDNRGGLPAVSSLTAEQVGEVLERASGFLDWLCAVKVHALELMQKGKAVPGYKPVAKNTRYAWNKELTPAKVARALGLKVEDVVETKMKSPSKLKKVMSNAGRGWINDNTWKPFAVILAPEGDRRQAIPSTKISFDPVHREEEGDDE